MPKEEMTVFITRSKALLCGLYKAGEHSLRLFWPPSIACLLPGSIFSPFLRFYEKMALNISGLVALLLFYALTLAVGIWASRKTRPKGHQKPSEVAMVGGRNMNFCIGLFTATGKYEGFRMINK